MVPATDGGHAAGRLCWYWPTCATATPIPDWPPGSRSGPVAAAVESAEDGALVQTPAGGMRLVDWLETRTFELAVHGLDVVGAVGVPAGVPQEVLAEAAGLRRVSRFLRRVGQVFVESVWSGGWLIHAAAGRAAGSGCLRTNRCGVRA